MRLKWSFCTTGAFPFVVSHWDPGSLVLAAPLVPLRWQQEETAGRPTHCFTLTLLRFMIPWWEYHKASLLSTLVRWEHLKALLDVDPDGVVVARNTPKPERRARPPLAGCLPHQQVTLPPVPTLLQQRWPRKKFRNPAPCTREVPRHFTPTAICPRGLRLVVSTTGWHSLAHLKPRAEPTLSTLLPNIWERNAVLGTWLRLKNTFKIYLFPIRALQNFQSKHQLHLQGNCSLKPGTDWITRTTKFWQWKINLHIINTKAL